MDRKIIFISYWTDKYQKAAERLTASLERLGLEHDITQLPSKGWSQAVRHKPTFILQMLEKHKDAYAVVWVDADGDVVQRPELFFTMEEDLGARFLYWNKGVDELLSGTLFVKNTPHMRETVKNWIDTLAIIDKLPDPDKRIKKSCPEQSVLQYMMGDTVSTKVVGKSEPLGMTYRKLDEPYCRIPRDRGRNGVPGDSVIVHYQFSRETRGDRTPAAHLSKTTKISNGVRGRGIKIDEPKVKKPVPRPARLKSQRKKVKPRVTNPRIPSEVSSSERRRKIHALRKKKSAVEIQAQKDAMAVRLAAGVRNRKTRAIAKYMNDPIPKFIGGVRGHAPTKMEISIGRASMASMNVTPELDGILRDDNVLFVLGNSPSVDTLDPEFIKRFPILGCNRALLHKKIRPDFLIMGDREPYCQELRSGRLKTASDDGVKIILSDSIFDPTILLRGPYKNNDRRAQPAPEFLAYMYRIGPRRKPWTYETVMRGVHKLPINVSTFESPVVSCLNVAGSMLQAAAILGAKTIVTLGIEMRWPVGEKSHFFGPGGDVGAYPQDGAIKLIQSAMRQIKNTFKKNGVKVINISPVKGSPFSEVFPLTPQAKFISMMDSREPFDRARLGKPIEVSIEGDNPVEAICNEAAKRVEDEICED